MNGRAKSWLKWTLVTIAATTAAITVAVALVIGTESGTRWLLGRVTAFAPVTISADQASGTLLTTLSIPSLAYEDAARVVRVADIALNIDWSQTGLSEVVIDSLLVRQVRVSNLQTAPTDPTLLEVSMPALPIGIRAAEVALRSLDIDETSVQDISVVGFAASGLELGAISAGASVDRISITASELAANIDGDVPVAATVEWRMDDAPWSGIASLSGDLRALEVTHQLHGDYPAHTHGTVALLQRIQPGFDLTTEFDGWQLQQIAVDDASVRVTGVADDYAATLSTAVTADTTLSAEVNGNLNGNLRGIEALDVTVDTPYARSQLAGSLSWAPQLGIDLLVAMRGFDPSTVLAAPQGTIDADIRLTAESAEQFTVEVTSLAGDWQRQTLSGGGILSRRGDAWRCARCALQVGTNRLAVDGDAQGRRLNGNIEIDAPALAQLWPGLSGSLQGGGRIGGSLAVPILSGEVLGSEIGLAGWSVASLAVQSRDSTLEKIDLVVDVSGLARDAQEYGGGNARVSGDFSAADFSGGWNFGDLAANIGGQLQVDEDTISGSLASASISEPLTGTWQISQPMNFHFAPGRLEIENGEWNNADARLSHPVLAIGEDRVKLEASMSRVPIGIVNPLMPAYVHVNGLVSASADLEQTDAGWSGDLSWQQDGTVVTLLPGEDGEFLLDVPLAEAGVRIRDNTAEAEARLTATPGMQAIVNVSVANLAPDAAVEARLRFSGDEWEWVTALLPAIDNIEGQIASDISASGNLDSPDLSGEFRWSDGQLAVPGLNLPLTGIDVTLSGTAAGDLTVAGRATSGEGPIGISGYLNDITSDSRSFELQLQGQEATVINWPGYFVTASPDLSFSGSADGIDMTGRVELDRAEIAVRELPEGAVRPSDDVTVEGRVEESRERIRVAGDVELVLSDDIHVQAFGLDTHVAGQLRFILSGAREPRAQGELRLVGGVFEAYGQRLEIEQGSMIFTGPLDNPLINVRAIRRIDGVDGTVIAGIHLTGPARSLSSSVYAEPAMSEANALSYLVLGRPLEDATAADGSNLSNTAYALGLRQAATITNQIGQTVGLDELRVSGNNQNTTELVAGKQVNSRLYARYAYGVFTRLGHLLLQYRLSDSFTIEIGAGQTQSMDIMYTIERE